MTITINDLVSNHDNDPAGTAQALKELAPGNLAEKEIPTYSWLLNHVLGELVGDWQGAHRLQSQITTLSNIPSNVHFNAAIAAFNAGKPLDGWRATSLFATASEINADEAGILVRQGVLQYSPAGEEASESFSDVLQSCLAKTHDWNGSALAARMLASSLTNIVSSWLEQPLSPAAAINEVMQVASARSQLLWHAGGGTWLNIERACYLRALVFNRLRKWDDARKAAEEGIETIDKGGEEDVDRACLLLELARAYGGLSRPDEQHKCREQAIAISETFPQKFPDEPTLQEWFEGLLHRVDV